MKYTTATFAIAMCNVLPALTFVMAWIFRYYFICIMYKFQLALVVSSVWVCIFWLVFCRLEKVNVKKLHSQGKILGTLITVGGAMVMTLVNGPPVPLPWTKGTGVHQVVASTALVSQDQHIKGAIMITAGCFCWASFYILQVNNYFFFFFFIFSLYFL